jgi:hypothetical protein
MWTSGASWSTTLPQRNRAGVALDNIRDVKDGNSLPGTPGGEFRLLEKGTENGGGGEGSSVLGNTPVGPRSPREAEFGKVETPLVKSVT